MQLAQRRVMVYNRDMRFRTGVLVGAALGYYYGAKAGQDRYLQIDAYLEKVRSSEAYRELIERLSELAEVSLAQTTDFVRHVTAGTADADPARPGSFDYVGDPTLN